MADPYNYSDGAAQSGRDQIVQALMGVQNPPPGGADPTATAAPPAPRTMPPDLGPTSAVPTPAQAPMGAVPSGNLPMARATPPMPIQGNPALQAQAMQSQLQPPMPQPGGSSFGAYGADQAALANQYMGMQGPPQSPLLSRASPPPLALPGQIQHY